MGGRSSGCRASSAGERIGESTITAPPSISPYWDATFIVIKPPKLWPMMGLTRRRHQEPRIDDGRDHPAATHARVDSAHQVPWLRAPDNAGYRWLGRPCDVEGSS